ncbi:hypothetical protein NEUTE1DRAFT_98949 [Neurospora tetrasperma FGSC 2508]|uniref:Rhodopsin domain-containing protein n=1 Tax=Neurospora tetrasperma (strain FGSC 2508 / ATCC MYA-4615 / P0657) TaxID=510951 RepID=F8MH69_NEUT8|nr:uncharacterized protein NEUTE1DRAFT_98949 [Neurospora tetrasperma FGSC 2508]EGO58734.1 hypothetical protein NEUTE1DRAFT_98949 [Neurospora tetrasperma FGSC 2508]EGZ72825.1 hypothetical protein NEUTE2DRAFT_60327 [Neurospora tetrasperma FGSC 2509]
MDLQDKGYSARDLLGVNFGSWALAFTAVALRGYTRLRVRRDCFGVDDILMFMSMVCFTVYVAFAITGIHHGTGHRDNDSTVEAKKFWWACYHAYTVTILFAKLSCKPIYYFWDQSPPGGKCVRAWAILAVGYTCSVFNIITDLVYALLPAWIIYHLQMKLKTRISLMILMGMGCLASCAVIARMTYLDELTDYQNSNFLFLTANVAIWSSVEQGLAITAGSLATLRPLIIKIGRKLGFASATSASANDIEFGPIGPPVLLRERTNSMFSRRGPSKPRGSNAVLLETETAVPFDGAHRSKRATAL